MKSYWTVIAVFFAASAHAYVPPSQFIVKTLGDKHGGVKRIRIRSEVIAFEDDKPSPTIRFKETTVYDVATDLMKSWVTDSQNKDLYGVVRKGGAISPATTLLLESNFNALAISLKNKGIPIKTQEEFAGIDDEAERNKKEISSLARLGTTIAWVIGMRDSSSQLWVEKDTFLPLRLLCSLGVSNSADVRYENYRFYREFPFPRLVTLAKSSTSAPLLKDELIEVMVYRDIKAIDARAAAQDKEIQGFTDAGNAAPGPIRDLIRLYYDSVR